MNNLAIVYFSCNDNLGFNISISACLSRKTLVLLFKEIINWLYVEIEKHIILLHCQKLSLA